MSRISGSRVIAFATWLLALLGAGLMYVSFDAQYTFIIAQKGARAASLIEAAMLDAGMVILSALGIGLAQAGKPSRSVRFLIMICAGASAAMNLAAADTASWRSMAAYTAAPVFLAVVADRVIAVIRQHVLPLEAESAWAPLGRATVAGLRLGTVVALYLLRTVLAPASTLRALRQMVLDAAPVSGIDLNIVTRFEELTQTAADALDAAAPRGPAAPCWIGLDRQAYAAQLDELRQWTDTVFRRHYGGYELRDCWPGHTHAIWELSTLAAAWHHAYSGPRPDLGRALEFHDRWLPGTMRRIAHITRACVPECAMRRHRPW